LRLSLRQPEIACAPAAVQRQEQRVTLDRSPARVGLVGRSSVDQHPEHVVLRIVPVGIGHLVPVGSQPGDVFDAACRRTAAEEASPAKHGIGSSDLEETDRVAEHLLLAWSELPIEPTDLVVLAVAVVVPPLGAADLVAAENHRYTLGEQKRAE